MIVGVDIGGTFTDFMAVRDGQLTIDKRLSTPHDPAESMLDGLRALSGGDLYALARVAHGSTVATNAILERKGARVALITTLGFHDVLFIGRQNRPDLYALHPQIPAPLIPRDRSYGVTERLDFRGDVLTPLDESALDTILDAIARQDVDAVAVCLLYSFVNPAHENRIRARIRERGLAWEVVLSHEVLPEFREYERASVTALEAYVRPMMSRYVNRIAAALPVPLRIMKSDGGVMRAARVATEAVQTALSGPAAGVVGAHFIAQAAGYPDLITLDIGGTSTDVALIHGGLTRRAQSEIDGLPLRTRLLDIDTVGAGGGSIARIDAGGALRVGPQSAGASPGPIAYGRGGQQVTVTDANVVLGRLDPAQFLGGRMALDVDAAHDALTALGAQMGMSAHDAARGVIEIANANIERAVRRVSVARGDDPRDFTLLAFGGAGGLHACAVAERLGMTRILIPRYPGVLCAYGLLAADVTVDAARALLGHHADSRGVAAVESALDDLITRTRAELDTEGIAPDNMRFHAVVEMRYAGQTYELPVPYHAGTDLAAAFHQAHARTYGHAFESRAVELVNVRVQAVGLVEKPALTPAPLSGAPLVGTHFARETLRAGDSFSGAALVTQMDSTTYVASGWRARVDAYYNLILEREAHA